MIFGRVTHNVILGLHLTSTPASRPQKNWSLNCKNRALTSGMGSMSSHLWSTMPMGLIPDVRLLLGDTGWTSAIKSDEYIIRIPHI